MMSSSSSYSPSLSSSSSWSSFWVAAPKGTKSCRTQGESVRPYIQLRYVPLPYHPDSVSFVANSDPNSAWMVQILGNDSDPSLRPTSWLLRPRLHYRKPRFWPIKPWFLPRTLRFCPLTPRFWPLRIRYALYTPPRFQSWLPRPRSWTDR